MSSPVFLIPKRSRPVWDAGLEPLDLADDPRVPIPLLGEVSAGPPVEAVEDREVLWVPRRLVRKASYALRVRGHSMTDDAIQDGDIIVLERRPTAENGETVVALIEGEQVTLKRFYAEAGRIRLQPANSELEPLYCQPDAVEVIGVVAAVVRGAAPG